MVLYMKMILKISTLLFMMLSVLAIETGTDEVRLKRENQPWQVDPSITRDENGNVITDIQVQRTGQNHDIHAGWSKVVRGPNRAKPTWNVGGNFRFRRDVQPWQVDPNIKRDENGNVISDLQVHNTGKNHDVHAGWSKVVRGPNRAKPTWNVGGSFRFRRDVQPWQVDPNISRDENGNVISDLQVHNTGKNHDVHAGWSKVVRGPNRAKPTWNVGGNFRFRRDVQPWQVDPNIRRDENGNVISDIQVHNTGKNHDVHAGWSKVVRGPNRAKPTWNVGGNFRFRRDVQPWQVDPNIRRDENGNVISDIQVHNTGKNHDVHAGWSKVVRGPNRAKPTWNVGGNFRFRRDVQPWQVDPNISRDENGNVISDLQVHNTGKNHDVHAGWSKVVRGPNRAKPTWNVGGSFRFRRDVQPWQVDPNISRDENGNVISDLQVHNTGKNHDVHAGWTKVVRGPNRAKPTWNVGGSFRFRRDVQPWQVDPNISRDENGNVISDLQVHNTGKNHDVHAGWSKVVRGPNRAKPTWNVGGSFRFRRDVQPWQVDPNIRRDENGNVISDLQVHNTGKNHDVHAGWSKVVRGPNRAKPTWNVGGSFRFRRDVQPWQVDPNISRDENGNVISDLQVHNTGNNHDIHAGWSKVVRGPNRAKPTWNVGGSSRFRRDVPQLYSDIDEDFIANSNNKEISTREKRSTESEEDNDDESWVLTPNIGRGEDGNTNADINVNKHGDNHDFHATWSKVVDGPNRMKPTWNIGGSFRF